MGLLMEKTIFKGVVRFYFNKCRERTDKVWLSVDNSDWILEILSFSRFSSSTISDFFVFPLRSYVQFTTKLPMFFCKVVPVRTSISPHFFTIPSCLARACWTLNLCRLAKCSRILSKVSDTKLYPTKA